jgi:hypothetical protein
LGCPYIVVCFVFTQLRDVAGDGDGRAYRGERDRDDVGERARRLWV